MAEAPFPTNPVLTGVAMAYTNPALIADQVLPRLPSIEAETFKYWTYAKGDTYTVPDTRMGRRSAPNEIEFSAAETLGTTKDYGLEAPLPSLDSANAAPAIDPEMRASELLTELVLLDREVRVASLVFAQATYPAANRAALSGTSQWSDFTNSDPIAAIMAALDIPVMRPNIAVIGRAVWTKLITHPKIVAATNVSGATAGVAQRQAVAAMLELDEILVGQSFFNSAKPGQTVTVARAWGKAAAFLYRDPSASLTYQPRPTFGFTVQYGARLAGSRPDPDIGLRGGTRVRVGESVAEVIAASDVGYLFDTAVA